MHEVPISIPENVSQFYEKMHGERWPVLLKALLFAETQVLRWNQFSNPLPEREMSPLAGKGEIPRDSVG
ncbi:MAG: hypothetical protein ACXWC9_08815, partial [Pseudobdellovibrionaceae bacterium]